MFITHPCPTLIIGWAQRVPVQDNPTLPETQTKLEKKENSLCLVARSILCYHSVRLLLTLRKILGAAAFLLRLLLFCWFGGAIRALKIVAL